MFINLFISHNLDSVEQQNREEEELLKMEMDQKVDKDEMQAMEEELLSDYDKDDDDDDNNYHLDSPYPSDSEDEEEFVVTDKLKLGYFIL